MVCFIEGATVIDLLGQNPSLGIQFLRTATKAIAKAENEVFQLTTLSLRTRLAHLLLVLIRRHD